MLRPKQPPPIREPSFSIEPPPNQPPPKYDWPDTPEFQLVASIDFLTAANEWLGQENTATHSRGEKIRKCKQEVNAAADLPVVP